MRTSKATRTSSPKVPTRISLLLCLLWTGDTWRFQPGLYIAAMPGCSKTSNLDRFAVVDLVRSNSCRFWTKPEIVRSSKGRCQNGCLPAQRRLSIQRAAGCTTKPQHRYLTQVAFSENWVCYLTLNPKPCLKRGVSPLKPLCAVFINSFGALEPTSNTPNT